MPKRMDLSGKKYNMLTVLEPTDRREARYTVWKCRCDCGNITYVNTRHLLRGTIKNCGCVPSESSYYGKTGEDITGQRFSKLVAVKRVENSRDGKTRWLCQCDCGNTKIVKMSELKSGHVKSCGCMRPHSTGRNLLGQRFSRLVALEKTEKRDSKGSIIWRCRCDCGNDTYVSEDSLVNGRTVSCGCRKRELMHQIPDTLTFVDGTCVDWLKSRKTRSDNTSGHTGVYKTKEGKYRVLIGFKRQKYYIGTYDNFAEAVSAREEAAEVVHKGFVMAYQEYTAYAKNHPEWAKNNPFMFEVEKVQGVIRVVRKTDIPKNKTNNLNILPG